MIFWAFHRPPILRKLIYKYLMRSPVHYYNLSSEGHEYSDKIGHYTIYRSEKKINTDLLVWFSANGIFYSDRRASYGILNELKRKTDFVDILVFDYPVTFAKSVHSTLLHIDNLINKVVATYNYKSLYACGVAIGALLMGAIIAKSCDKNIAKNLSVPFRDSVQFRGMVGVCGLYRPNFKSRLMRWLFKSYMMRGTASPKLYSCYDLPGIPKLIIGSTNDPLRRQTYNFINRNECEHLLFSDPKLPNGFYSIINIPETMQIINTIRKFLYNCRLNQDRTRSST
ncbi:uncharacterized protein [Bemisia tabaci]|uniref:uncharacterized protein n=1 Tax=Bemisia tabaci TaxID=7038 RepID=UPI003B28504F